MDAGHLEARGGPSVAGEGTIRVIAEAAFLGIPIDRFIRSRDPEELQLLEAVRKEAAVILDETLTSLARKIVQETADAQERGRKGK